MTFLELLGALSPLFVLAGVIITAVLALRGKKDETAVAATNVQESALAARMDDAIELSAVMRAAIEAEVERQVAPMREALQKVKDESREMHDAVRARETQLWLWDQRGRPGDLPMLPSPILQRLGLGHLVTGPFEDTEPIKE
ncbi:hypothetical protein [Microbacterium sp. NFH-22A-Y]|uniref:hypothetical protein n=1 Tax=Microbacterium sp. NFH-22A-Y TaxID=2744448 RepID=UPI001F40F1E2|nr:hypothetical protein [Microbacterium sp. NFH-22A-Y]